MLLFHDSQDIRYRSPFGAVPTDSRVRLCLRAEGSGLRTVWLRLFMPCGEQKIPMEADEENANLYYAEISVGSKPCLLWYDFMAETENGNAYYCNNTHGLGGIGQQTEEQTAESYQITVYEKEYHTPEWFRERIMYQIFPDRFFGSHGGGEIPKKRDEYIIHYDRYEPLSFQRHPAEDGPACNDFYGGNIKGIQEKLPYLKSLGVGVLYLNPIFEAYSNHRYDTADYKRIDPMLGTEEDFRNLCAEAEKYDIRIILDGVFSHTGADSIYFNKYGNYGENSGAYRDSESPYRSWYSFNNYPTDYDSWWGCSNLPNVNELEPSYINYILKDDAAVIKKWVRDGAAGWRLDVADELPDEFIKILRSELKSERPDAVIIGEVWEDASNKIAYGKRREYLLGGELDSVMNYPFKDCILGFIMGYEDAQEMNRHIMSQVENYPTEALYSMMNILGTHDTMRVKSLLGNMSSECTTERLSSGNEELAVFRLKLASFIQMTFYGVPCIYYGDEVGMEGGKDPYNRSPYPWRRVDNDLREWYRELGRLRNSSDCLKRGYFKPLYASGDVYVYARYFADGRDVFGRGGSGFALCAVNRSFETRKAEIPLGGFGIGGLTDKFSGEKLRLKDELGIIELPPLTAKIYTES